jgi:CheY-like chemotaxis protein
MRWERRVLFARFQYDSSSAILDVVADMLDDLGCEVICPSDGTDALTILASDKRIEILITDINMPSLAGYELAKKAKRVRPGIKPILLSGRESDPRGFPMIRKPFFQDDLRRVIKETTGIC